MKKVVAVLGLGLFGSAVAKTMAENGIEVIAIDSNMDHVEEVMDFVDVAVQADFTKIDQLEAAGVRNADIAVVATGEKLEITILGIMNLKKMGIQDVIVKTKNVAYKEVLIKVGATRVILPEAEMGMRLGRELSNATIIDFLQLDERYHILEITAKEKWIGKTIIEANLRETEGYNIIAINPHGIDDYMVQLDPNYVFKEGDVLIVISENSEVNKSLSL